MHVYESRSKRSAISLVIGDLDTSFYRAAAQPMLVHRSKPQDDVFTSIRHDVHYQMWDQISARQRGHVIDDLVDQFPQLRADIPKTSRPTALAFLSVNRGGCAAPLVVSKDDPRVGELFGVLGRLFTVLAKLQ